jgi:hypothetical protein
MYGGGAEFMMEHMNNAPAAPAPIAAALRALKVFAGVAVSVVLLGESSDERLVRAR